MTSHNSKYSKKSLKRNTVESKNFVHMFKNIAQESNGTETNNALVSENSTPTCNADHDDDEIFSHTEEASDSVNSSQQSTDTPPFQTKPASNKASDIRVKSTSRYETLFPDFYFSSARNGWLCKICSSFSHGPTGSRAFIDKPC